MRKQLKRAGALLLALVMTMAMAVTAFANDDEGSSSSSGNITISGVTTDEQVTANAYQVLEYNSTTGAWVLTEWAEAALSANGGDATTALAVLTNSVTSSDDDSEDGGESSASTNYSNSYTLAKYLTTLAKYASENSVTASATATNGESEGSYSSSITLDTTTLGAYLVVLSSDSYSYTNMYVNNFDSSASGSLGTSTAAAKSTKDNIIDSKTASDTSVAIGDTITYTVTATMPNFSGNSGRKLVITDTLSTNTSLVTTGDNDSVSSSDVTIEVGDTSLTYGTDYTVILTTDSDSGQQVLTITFTSAYLEAWTSSLAGATITITYKVTVTGYESDNVYTNSVKATINTTGNSSDDTDGEEVKETVETVALKLSKVDGSNNAITTSSASFQLSYTVDETTYYVTATESSEGSGVYTVSGSTTESSSATTFSTSTTDGTLTIQGLDPSYTYTLTETAAPTGYSTAGSTTLTFTAETSDNTATESGEYCITFTNSNSAYTSATDSNETAAVTTLVTVTDTVLGSLPTTGGMGILVLTFAGVVMIALFGGAFVALKKRK